MLHTFLIIKAGRFGRSSGCPRRPDFPGPSDLPIDGPCSLHISLQHPGPLRNPRRLSPTPTPSSSPLSRSLSLPPSLPTREAAQANARDDLDGGPKSARRRRPSSSFTPTTPTPLPRRGARQRVARPRVWRLRRRSSPRPRGQPADALTPRRPLAAEEPPWWPYMTTGRSRQQPRRWIWSGRSRGLSWRPI